MIWPCSLVMRREHILSLLCVYLKSTSLLSSNGASVPYFMRWNKKLISPLHGAGSFSRSQYIVRAATRKILRLLEVHCRDHKKQPPVPTETQTNPIHSLQPDFHKIHHNIILPSTPRSFRSYQNIYFLWVSKQLSSFLEELILNTSLNKTEHSWSSYLKVVWPTAVCQITHEPRAQAEEAIATTVNTERLQCLQYNVNSATAILFKMLPTSDWKGIHKRSSHFSKCVFCQSAYLNNSTSLLGYLTAILNCITCVVSNSRMIVNYKFWKIWTEVVVTCFKTILASA
jgi:hypothetical protein